MSSQLTKACRIAIVLDVAQRWHFCLHGEGPRAFHFFPHSSVRFTSSVVRFDGDECMACLIIERILYLTLSSPLFLWYLLAKYIGNIHLDCRLKNDGPATVPTKCTLVCCLESRLKLLAGVVPTISIMHPASLLYNSLRDMDGVCQREIDFCLRTVCVCVVFKKECEIIHFNHQCNN